MNKIDFFSSLVFFDISLLVPWEHLQEDGLDYKIERK